MKQEYNVNIDYARLGYDTESNGLFNMGRLAAYGAELNPKFSSFAKYSPAYISTNENLPEIIKCLEPKGKTALAIAGSGDMPLYLTAFGAKHVDTFDISFNAQIVMDVKTYMLKNKMYLCDYASVLRELKTKPDITKSKSWDVISRALTADAQKYLYAMRGCMLFTRSPNDMAVYIPDAPDFHAMQESVHGRYNFIWSDLFDLSGIIQGQKYDIIYLSNVLQYVSQEQDIINVLNELRPNLNNGGTIVIDSLLQNGAVSRKKKYENVGAKIAGWGEMIYMPVARTMFLRLK